MNELTSNYGATEELTETLKIWRKKYQKLKNLEKIKRTKHFKLNEKTLKSKKYKYK